MTDFWEQFETAETTQSADTNNNDYWSQFPEGVNEGVNNSETGIDTLGKWGKTTISATPKKNLLTQFQECLNWVNNTRLAAYQEGKEQVEIANLEAKDMLKIASQKDLQRLEKLTNKEENTYNIPEKRKFIDNNETNVIPRIADTISIGAKKGYVEALKMLPYMWETVKATAGGSAIGAAGGALVGTGIGLATTKANTAQLALQGARVGGAWGGRISGSMKLAELEGGLARNELRQINQEIIQEGGEPLADWEINALAIGVGGVNAGLEYVGLRQVLKTVPNGDKILNYLEKKQIAELARDKTVREQLRGVLGQYAKTIATEMTTEMAQESTNIVAEHIAQKLGKVECTPLEQNVARVLETGKATFGATLYLGGVGSAGKVVAIKTKQGISKLQAQKEAESMSDEQKSEFVAENLDTLFSTINDIPEVKDLENRNELKNKFFTQNLNAGVEKEEALHNATIESEAVANLANSIGMDMNELQNEFGITVKNLDEEQAQKVLNGEVSIDEYINEGVEAEHLFQSISQAGINNENEIADAQKEWQEKGTESKYFKKFSDNAPVVTVEQSTNYDFKTGEKVAVQGYHGTQSPKLKGNQFKNDNNEYFFTNNKNAANDYGDNIYDVYISMKNPLVIDFNGENDKQIFDYIDEAKEKGYDGLIAKNTFDGANNHTQYVVFDNRQIKSVSNRGTFDSNNSNIYFQSKQAEVKEPENLVDLTNEFEKVPTFEEVENHLKEIINSGISFETRNKNYKIDIKQTDVKRGKHDATNVVDKLTKRGNKHNQSIKRRNNKYLKVIEKLIKNSELKRNIEKNTDGYENNKKTEKPHVKQYFNFDVPVAIGETIYTVRLQAEEWKNDKSKNGIKTVHLYNIYENKKTSRFAKTGRLNNSTREVNNNITDNKENINPNVNKHEDDRNLLMVHATKENNLDSILESGSLVAPSMAVINKDENEIKFGNIIFIRNPKKIDYQNDNIHDRDIYSPRLPQADYMTSDGVFVSAYEYDSMERLWKSRPEKFKELYGNETFDEYFKGAKKVINMGFTPSGNRKTIPYNNENILNYIKKESLKGGENGNYGLSSLLARLAEKQTSKQKLKETAKENLKTSSEELTKKWDDIKKEYDSIGDKLAEYYFDKYYFYEVQEEVFYAIAKNNKRILNEYFADFNKIPKELIKEVKDFIEKAKSIPRSYFEAKPMQEVSLSQYSNVVAKKGVLTDEQKAKLQEWGVTPIEYEGDNLSETLENIDKENRIFFQGEGEDLSDKRGFTVSRENFDGTTKDNLIVLLKNKTDKSTLLHEFAHVYLITLNRLARNNDKAKELLTTVNKWLNYNGKEYTRKQHEKFANGFVAYVRAGKAPTYKLKRAFENFKKWLKDTFVSLEYNDGVEIDDDTRKVFDELLGDMSAPARDERINDILKKARDNANLRIRFEEEADQRVPINQLTDEQKKYRDTAYDILWYALSNTKNKEGKALVKDRRQLYMLLANDNKMNKKNKGVMKQGEKLAEILNELDDVFTAGDGVLPEWREFFHVPEDSGDYDSDLATQAYNVINEKKYLRVHDVEKYEDLIDKDIQTSKYEFEYIIDVYKNGNKDDAITAFFTWIDNVHPYIQEDIVKDWELKTNEIDRYESLSKFEKAKEDLKLYAAKLKGHGDYSTQFAQYARAILKRLDFMTELDKAKMLNVLKDYNSFSEIERNLDFVMDYAQTLDDVSYRRNLADTIVNEVKTTIPEKINGTKKTKYDYRTNKLFERLRELNKLKQEEIQDLYDGFVNGEIERRTNSLKEDGTIPVKSEDYFEDIERSFLQFKANGMYYNSTETLETLLDKIQNAKFTGKIARDEMDFQKRMEQRNWIDACASALESHRGKAGKLEELYSMEANFDSILSMIFDDNVKDKFSLDDLYARVDGRVGKDRQEVLDKIADAFGFTGALKGAKLNNKFIEMASDRNYVINQRYANKEDTDSLGVWNWEPITLSRMEILYYYIQAKNPVSYTMLTDMGDENRAPKGQFDKFEFDELLTNLSDQEKLMGDILQTAAEKYYNDLNRYHINKHHIDMGRVTCYFPRKSEMTEVNELDLFNNYTEKSTNPKFVKMRTAGPSVRISPANPVEVLFNHIQKANTIIIMGEQLDLINKVFRDNDLRQKIKSIYGDTVYKELMQHVTDNLYTGQAKALSTAESTISKLMSNIIGAPIMIKPQIALKQMMSMINYGVGDKYVSTTEWMKEFGNVLKNPAEAVKYMLEDEYLKDRVSRGNLNEALKNQLENSAGAKLGILSEFFSLNMRIGDIAAIAFGGKAYIDVLMKKGYTKEQAFEIFRKKTVNDQQSSINSTLSNLQRNSKNNVFAKLLFAYQNTPHQYFRTCANAVIKAKQGKMSKTQAAKTIIIYWYVFPLMFNMATSLSPLTLLATGDPEELYTDLVISLLGNISCIPFFGEMARAVWTTITGGKYLGKRDWFSRANQAIVQPIKKLQKDELTFFDIWKSLEVFAQGAGIPLEEISTQVEALGDYAHGDILKGAVKTMGYSRARADVVTGDK